MPITIAWGGCRLDMSRKAVLQRRAARLQAMGSPSRRVRANVGR